MTEITNRRANPRTLLAYAITGITAALLGVLVAWALLQNSKPDIPEGGSTVALPQPRDIAPAVLTDETGAAASLDGGWGMLFYGFTHCPDICPQTLHLLQQAVDQLPENLPAPTVYLVSVDPARDTPELLGEYVHAFNPKFKALVGDETEVKKIAQSMGAAFFRAAGGDEKDYNMNHTAAVFVVNPQGKLAGYSNAPHSVESLKTSYEQIIKAAKL